MPGSYSGQENAYRVANRTRNALSTLGDTFVARHDGYNIDENFGVSDGSWFDMTRLFGHTKWITASTYALLSRIQTKMIIPSLQSQVPRSWGNWAKTRNYSALELSIGPRSLNYFPAISVQSEIVGWVFARLAAVTSWIYAMKICHQLLCCLHLRLISQLPFWVRQLGFALEFSPSRS